MTQEELSVAEKMLKKRFGREWKQIVQTLGTKELTSCVGRDFTSFLAFPARDEGGDNRWRGNCAPQVVEKVIAYALESNRFEGKDMIHIGKQVSHVIKAQFHCASETKAYESIRPFIPIVTEHLLIFQKDSIIKIPFSVRKEGIFDVSKEDCKALTWLHLIRMALETAGGTLSLAELYRYLEKHPKARKNRHYQARIRATIYEHRENFLTDGKGTYRLSYANAV